MNFLNAKWENIVMANYSVPPELLKAYLPAGCELDLYQGSAYISLVGFMFKKTKLFKIPIPILGTFEEINLRFYVIRKEGDEIKRGVVFINETIPYKAVAWVANKLYKEHYTAIPTKNFISINPMHKKIEYQWQTNKLWNSMYVESSADKVVMQTDSFEEFIFEHYYGYTKIDNLRTEEYKIYHPRWDINKIKHYNISCDFGSMYGNHFTFLNTSQPKSVFLAEGSEVSVKWKRETIKLEIE
jgi:uncharacterized protein YqjF (DUF2071 family)